MNALVLSLVLLGPGAGESAAAVAASSAGGALMGSVASGPASAEPLELSISDAVARGLQHNLALVLAQQGVRGAEGARWEALSEILPHLSGRFSASRQKINLEAYGFTGLAGVPTVVGPFNVVDARLAATENLVDLEALHKTHARDQSLAAAHHSYQDTRDLVVLVCGSLYLQALAEEGRIDAARAQLETARALEALAQDRKQAGLVPAVDLLRAQVTTEERRQQLIVAENRAARAKLVLARAIGAPLGQALRLTDSMPHLSSPVAAVDEALARAYAGRADWKAAQARVRAAEEMRSAALGQALPKLVLNADIGAIGQTLAGARETYTLGAALQVPLFEGGKAIGKRLTADAGLQAERAALEDLRGRIDYEVRSAELDIAAAAARVSVAERSSSLAQEQLRQAQDRFEAGVTNNIDLVAAQEALADAAESRISAVYDYNLARATLAHAEGGAEAAFQRLVRGE